MVKEDASMIGRLQAIVALALLTLAAGVLRAESASNVNLSHAELANMIRTVHTPQQYQSLARYYRALEASFEKQAQNEKAEWDRRSQNVVGPATKYPRQADSSRNRYEYFVYEAQQMSQHAAHYERLLASANQEATEAKALIRGGRAGANPVAGALPHFLCISFMSRSRFLL
jgi:hypothetical protein